MIHLSYHPAFDAFHFIFRTLRIKNWTGIRDIEFDKLRILDYYLLFPWRATAIKLAQGDLKIRRLAKQFDGCQDYATLPAGETLLERMRPAQIAGLQTMAQDEVVDAECLRSGIVRFNDFTLSRDLLARIAERNTADASRQQIIDALNSYPLLGPNGLKDRTALLEHRYDAV